MDRIYIDAKDKNVAVRILYGKTSGDYLYYDEKTTQKVSKDDAFDAFIKGALVLMNGEYHKILQCKPSESGLVMTAHNGTSAVTFKTEGASAAAMNLVSTDVKEESEEDSME